MEFIYDKHRIYAEDEAGKLLAEVTFPIENGVADITHTFVDASLGGQGIAGQLMELVAAHLHEKGLKAKLSCSYALKWFSQHPEHQGLFYWSCGETQGMVVPKRREE